MGLAEADIAGLYKVFNKIRLAKALGDRGKDIDKDKEYYDYVRMVIF